MRISLWKQRKKKKRPKIQPTFASNFSWLFFFSIFLLIFSEMLRVWLWMSVFRKPVLSFPTLSRYSIWWFSHAKVLYGWKNIFPYAFSRFHYLRFANMYEKKKKLGFLFLSSSYHPPDIKDILSLSLNLFIRIKKRVVKCQARKFLSIRLLAYWSLQKSSYWWEKSKFSK